MVDVHDAMKYTPDIRPGLPAVDLTESIARTNLSEVWRGIRRADGADVVIKFATTTSGPEMLRKEAQTVEALREARVPRVIPAEYRSDPEPHLLLPWKGSRTMRDMMDGIQGGDDRGRVIAAFFALVETVDRVHQERFIHGDLKPENVVLDGNDRPWLTDFGMARTIRSARLDSHISMSMSTTGDGWGGTLHYLPPEGLQGEAPTSSWDVYALGVMLHEILLGRRPDRAATPESLKAVLPNEVVDVLLSALAYSPEDRIPSARVFLARLEGIRTELVATGPKRWMMRSGRLALTGLAAFFVALRYGMVIALLGSYVGILVAAGTVHPTVLFAFLPFLLLHIMTRWEGPETYEEARARNSGKMVINN